MIRVDAGAWSQMIAHARSLYPEECVGAMLGRAEDGAKKVEAALPMHNASEGPRRSRYTLAPSELRTAEAEARRRGLTLIGIYHSHPDCEAYFSETDLKNSCPWYSFVVLSIRGGEFDHARSWLPDADQRVAKQEPLVVG